MSNTQIIPGERIERAIYLIRGGKAMLDRDLAKLYEVQTGALNQAVRRNRERFPEDFMFQLGRTESLLLQNEIANGLDCTPYVRQKQLPMVIG